VSTGSLKNNKRMASKIPTSMLDCVLLLMRVDNLYNNIRALVICGLQFSSNILTILT